MPLYSYYCQSCPGHFDVFQSMSNHANALCPMCHELALQLPAAPRIGTDVTGIWHNFDEPINVRGKQHLKDLCEQQGLSAPGALD